MIQDLTNTTFIIPIHIESSDRYNNAKSVLGYLNNHFKTNVFIHEKTIDSSKLDFLSELQNLNVHHFLEVNSLEYYHRTRQLNEMLNRTQTPVVVNYDIDVILPLDTYITSVNTILNGDADFVYPYQLGMFQRQVLTNCPRENFNKTFNISDLEYKYIVHNTTGFGHCFFANTEKYKKSFGENENFIAYGPEDEERPIRFEKLGNKILRVGDYIYHFEHSRTKFSSIQNEYFRINEDLFNQLKRMDKTELLNYYNKQEYIKKYKGFHDMITETGFWLADSPNDMHVHNEQLADWIAKYFQEDKDKQIIDFGCGLANYLKCLQNHGYEKLFGFEGDIKPGSPDFVSTWDLSTPIENYENYNELKQNAFNTICLEVGEHIPKQYESIFLNNITSLTSNKIILSWAVVGQGGDGHVNCMNNDEVISKMENLGFSYLSSDTEDARKICRGGPTPWFLNTILIFQRK